MKKILTIFIILTLILCLVGCGTEQGVAPPQEESAVVEEENFPTEKDEEFLNYIQEHAELQKEILMGLLESINISDYDLVVEYAILIQDSSDNFLTRSSISDISNELKDLDLYYSKAASAHKAFGSLIQEAIEEGKPHLIDEASEKLEEGMLAMEKAVDEMVYVVNKYDL